MSSEALALFGGVAVLFSCWWTSRKKVQTLPESLENECSNETTPAAKKQKRKKSPRSDNAQSKLPIVISFNDEYADAIAKAAHSLGLKHAVIKKAAKKLRSLKNKTKSADDLASLHIVGPQKVTCNESVSIVNILITLYLQL